MKTEEKIMDDFGNPKKNSFQVPEGYFEKLPLQIMLNRELRSFKRTYWAWTSAVCSLSLAVVIYFFIGGQDEKKNYVSEKQSVQEEYIQQEVTEEELIDFYLLNEESIN